MPLKLVFCYFTPIVIGSPTRGSNCQSEQFQKNEQDKCPKYISEKTVVKQRSGLLASTKTHFRESFAQEVGRLGSQ